MQPGRHLRGVSGTRDDYDQVPRKQAFQAEHPEVLIGPVASGTWQAVIPEEAGETVITRYELRDLLDALEEKFSS